jgi:hypothetical protein
MGVVVETATHIVILADRKDPDDPLGRTYRQVNAAKRHAIPVGMLVELEDGVRMWVVSQTRDCDQTPLYELSPDREDVNVERQGFRNQSWHGGYPEYALRPIVANKRKRAGRVR